MNTHSQSVGGRVHSSCLSEDLLSSSQLVLERFHDISGMVIVQQCSHPQPQRGHSSVQKHTYSMSKKKSTLLPYTTLPYI